MAETALGTDALQHAIEFDAPEPVRRSLAAMGRTEDVRLSPDGRRLAFACYARDQLAVADVEIRAGAEVVVTGLREYRSPYLREPHGVDFVDLDTVVVANRAGALATFGLPPRGADGELRPIGALDCDGALDGPGSVAVRSLDADSDEVLVCNNWADSVTRHTLETGDDPSGGVVALRKWLDLPDGLAVSHDGGWLAVSNHNSHSVLIYECALMHEDADPVGILRGVHYPHGLRFAGDDRHLLVADAATPYVHVFATSRAGWRGVRYPSSAIRVMDDETFARGRHNPQEGGPKGIDVEPRTNVLVVTSEYVPLAFFDVTPALRGGVGSADDAPVHYELHVLEETRRVKEAAATATARLLELQQTKAWRLVQRPRGVYSAVRRVGRRLRRGP